MWDNATHGIWVNGLQAFIGSAAHNSDEDASTASMRRLRMGTLYKKRLHGGDTLCDTYYESGGIKFLISV